MERFDHYTLESNCDYLKLSVETLLEIPNAGNEDFLLGTPKCWDETLLERLSIDQYDIYFLCAHFVPHNEVSRITDYRKIWGLCNLLPGNYENAYDNEHGRIYFGIVKTDGAKGFSIGISPFLLLVPKGRNFTLEHLFHCFLEEKYNFEGDISLSLISRIKQVIHDGILLHYCIFPQISLSIYGKDVQMLFDEQDCLEWENRKTVPVYKAFFRTMH